MQPDQKTAPVAGTPALQQARVVSQPVRGKQVQAVRLR
jgi:hypothetical protein